MYSFGERLKKLRIEAGMTQEQLGELVGLTKQAIYRMEKDKNKYSNNELIKKFAFHLSCSPDYLLGLSDNKFGTRDNKILPASFDPAISAKERLASLYDMDFEYASLVLECKNLERKDFLRLKKIMTTFIEE